jgi:hypothetical protein
LCCAQLHRTVLFLPSGRYYFYFIVAYFFFGTLGTRFPKKAINPDFLSIGWVSLWCFPILLPGEGCT